MPADAPGTKRCAECKRQKSASDFTVDRQRKDGRYVYCKECTRARARRDYSPKGRACKACGAIWRPKTRGRTALCGECIQAAFWCGDCKTAKPHCEFHTSATTRPTQCKKCMTDRALRFKYGLTQVEYDSMLAGQAGGCAICRRTPSENGRALSVDHDHSCCPGVRSCGKCLRGLLCTQCNYGLGHFVDSQTRLLEAVEYLKRAG